MKTLQISEFELVYMLAQILWSARGMLLTKLNSRLDIIGLSENALRLSEEISNQISNELHDYYTQEKHLTNYASRLTNLNKIIASTEVKHWYLGIPNFRW